MLFDERKALLGFSRVAASIIERMGENARQRVEEVGSAARADAVKRAEADRVVIEGLRCEIDRLKTTCSANGADWEHASKACGITDDEYPLKAVLRVVAERNALAATLADCEAISEEIRKQNNGLLIQVQDQREEINRVNDAHGKTQVECNALRAEVAALQERLRASIARGDFADIEVARLKAQAPKYRVGDKLEWHKLGIGVIPVTVTGVRLVYDCLCDGAEYPVGHSEEELREPAAQTPKQHPVKVGEWVKAPLGTRGKVVSLGVDYLEVELTNGLPTRWWPVYMCEPCDPPEASHDTPAGKEAAEAVIRESRSGEVMLGDVVEVVSDKSWATFRADIGRRGKVTHIGERMLDLEEVPGHALPAGGVVGKCDVRKVPQ